ncbi:YD repeat protein [Conexibacter woesei DSM 14684]|uniref:YD repeat protein n=2 Tax=Conexibacter TaxID=191494 RepID=D3F9F5_CONWI|nr:YD repeat protein [Conexibacter woesei DSM 14684]
MSDRTLERARAVKVPPGANGPIEFDLSPLVTDWRRWTATNGQSGIPNNGVRLEHEDWYPGNEQARLWCPYHIGSRRPECDRTDYASKFHPDPALRPVLEVRSWPTAPAGSAVISPEEGELTGRFVRLQARALHSSVTGVQFQYIAGNARRWVDIPAAALRTTNREQVTNSTIPVSGPTGDRRSEMAVWDLAATPGGEVDGPVHVRAYLESSQLLQGGATPEVNFRADRAGIVGTANAAVGPGAVDLMTGEFSMGETDASQAAFLGKLALSRTYSSRGVPRRNADMFGPGWEGSVDPDGGDLPYKGIYNFTEIREETEVRHKISAQEYDWELFNNQILNCWLEAEDEAAERACLAKRPTIGYTVEDLPTTKIWEYRYAVVEFGDGTKARFKQTRNPDGQVTGWEADGALAGYKIDHQATATAGVWEFVLTEPGGGVARFRSEIGGSPYYRIASYQQSGSTSQQTYTYEPSGNRQRLKRVTAPYPTGGTPRWMDFQWGDVGGRNLRVVAVRVGSGTGTGTTVARYTYNARGRLLRAWDPRTPTLVTEYVYDTRGLLSEVRPPGEEEWRLTYDEIRGDIGYRLTSVSRDHPDGGTATRTIRYDVPLTGPSAPYDMSTGETARWGQADDLPWQAVAIFPEDDVPPATNVDYSRATIHYLNLDGREVNVAAPGGHLTTTEYDANGNTIRELSATNRQRALDAGASSATIAHDLSTLRTYSQDGADLIGTYEPRTNITLSNGTVVTGRRFTTTHYDQGAPAGGPYHLPTSRWRGVEIGPGNRADERQTVEYGYNGHGGMSGWVARRATTTTIDPAGERLTSYSILHPTYPLVEETRRPRGAAGGARPDVRFYQYADVAPSSRIPAALRTGSVCEVGAPSGFLCMDSESTTPTASVVRRWYRFDPFGQQTDLWESKTLTRTGAPARHTQTIYDTAGRVTNVNVAGGQGEPVPTTTFTYSPTTGRRATVAANGRGTIISTHDSNGRLSQYTDTTGLITRYAYNLRGRMTQTVEDGGRTVRYGYDTRENLITVNDPDLSGPITADYDADGMPTNETLPSGLRARYVYDESGTPTSLTWEQTTGCASDCVRARSVIDGRDADGRNTGHRAEGEDETYSYDRVGRLAQVATTAGTICVRQQFVYDASYNRTRADTVTSAPAGRCGTGTASAQTWSHDVADRVMAAGWTHDDFGRATSVPAPDSGGRGILTGSYYTDDLVRQLSLDGRTHTYDRDPTGRTTTVNSTGGAAAAIATTNRYADSSDAPVLTTRSDGTAVREISGATGNLVALKDGVRLDYQLTDLLGNIVATVPASAADSRPVATTTYDPFGTITSDAPNVIDWTTGTPGYGWLGGRQRTTQFEQVQGAGPPMEMGVRVYLPGVGRFLQRDPVEGGSANPYEYAFQDPVNKSDLSGAMTCENLMGSFCQIDDWIHDAVVEPIRSGTSYIFKKCLAGSGWGTVFSIGRYLYKSKDTVGSLLGKLRMYRQRMNTFVYTPRQLSVARLGYEITKKKLHNLGKIARSSTGIGVGIACIDGVFGEYWPVG